MSNQKKDLISFLGIIGIGLTTVIGSGIWRDGLTWPNFAGLLAIVVVLISWLLMFSSGLAYAECVSMFPKSGGPYSFVGGGIGKKWGIVTGLAYIIGYAFITVILGFLTALFTLNAIGLDALWALIVFTLGFIILFGILAALSSLRTFGTVAFGWVVVKIVLLVIVAIFSFANLDTANWNTAGLTSSNFFKALNNSIFALLGFEVMLIFAGEVDKTDMKKIKGNVKNSFAIITALVVILIVYLLVVFGGSSIVSIGSLTDPDSSVAVLNDLATRTGLPSTFIFACAAFSAGGTLYALMMLNIHQLKTMALDESLPKVFTKTTKKGHYHVNSITSIFSITALGAIMMGVLAVTGSDFIISLYGVIGIGLILLSAMITAGAIALYLRIKMPILERPFKAPMYYIVFPLAIILGILLLVVNILSIF